MAAKIKPPPKRRLPRTVRPRQLPRRPSPRQENHRRRTVAAATPRPRRPLPPKPPNRVPQPGTRRRPPPLSRNHLLPPRASRLPRFPLPRRSSPCRRLPPNNSRRPPPNPRSNNNRKANPWLPVLWLPTRANVLRSSSRMPSSKDSVLSSRASSPPRSRIDPLPARRRSIR